MRHRLRHTSAHAARIFADVVRGRWRPKSPTHISIRLCLLEFCISIFVVSCSCLTEVRQCPFSYVPLYITEQLSCRSFKRAPHYFYICRRLTAFLIHSKKKPSWIYVDIAVFQGFKVQFPPLLTQLRGFCQSLSRRKSKNKKCKFEFRVNNKQRVMFHQGPRSSCL